MQIAHHFETFPEMMTVNETADFLRIPRPTVYYLINKGRLPAIRISGRWRVRKSEVEEALNLHRGQQAGLIKERATNQSVLVIEDNPAQQKLYSRLFDRLEVDYHVCACGLDGIEAVQNQSFDLVFLDLQLPDQPGDEVFAKLKKIDPDLPIVVATGYSDSSMLDKILAHGPTLVIRKPLEPKLMKQALGFHAK